MKITSVEGMHDMLPARAQAWARFKAAAARAFGRYGYLPIETPIVEQTELFVRGVGQSTDVVSKEMYTAVSGGNLQKIREGERLKSSDRLSLRPEGTAGVVRAVVQHDLVPAGAAPVKLMYAGPMFRAERHQKGRQREFNQIGIECLGAESPTIDAEGIIMLMQFFEGVGIPREAMSLLVNSLGCEKCRPAYREQVRAYMADHAADLCDTCMTRMDLNPLRAFDCKEKSCEQAMLGAPKITDFLCKDCRDHYAQVISYLDDAGIGYVESPQLVRGLDYYTRTVFEVQASIGMGSQNAIGGGGRYDKLSEEVGGRPTPGFGFALGFERCALALEAAGVTEPAPNTCELFVACAGDTHRAQVFNIAQLARANDIRAELDHQSRSLKSQFKLADKLGAKFVAVLGDDEAAAGCIRLRNMQTREEQVLPVADAIKIIKA